jgi:response regulator RpfG family c-di-GMP phosphodiesterase
MTEAAKILFVDDEKQMLTALNRVFRGKSYSVFTANSGAEALEFIKDQAVDIIVSDMRMPEMDGATFLAESVKILPNSRRVLLTGYADQESTVRAINEGQVHQYLMKPWDNTELKNTIDGEIQEKARIASETPDKEEHLQLQDQVANVTAELADAHLFADMAKEELLKQYSTTIKVISNLINLRTPTPTTMNNNVVSHSVAMAKLVKLDPKVINEIRNAARLYQAGKLAITPSLLNKKIDNLNDGELLELQKYAVKGSDLLTPLNSLDFAAKLIRHQNENIDGTGYPNKLKANQIPLGSRILRIVRDYHEILMGLYFDDPFSSLDALDYMENHANKKYDKTLLELYRRFIKELSKADATQQDRLYTLADLTPGMTVSRDLLNADGILLITKDTELTDLNINKLQELQDREEKQLNIFIKEE